MMARSFSNAKAVSAFIANEISVLTVRRGYAAASHGVVSNSVRGGGPNVMMKKRSEDSGKTAWVPDPETGYYRPENAKSAGQDPVELREMHMNKTTGGQ